MADRWTTLEIRDLSPPGPILADALEERRMHGSELARRAGLSVKHVSQLINARVPLSADVAVRLERVLGIPAKLWLNLENNYRAEQKQKEEWRRLRKHADWARRFPIRKMREARYFGDDIRIGQDSPSRVAALLRFFGVASPDAWENQWEHVRARFRKAKSFDPDSHTLTAWLRRGHILAQEVECKAYDADGFRELLQRAREWTTLPAARFVGLLADRCARVGVAVAFVPSLPKLALSGAACWLDARTAAIYLSLRHRSDDHLWFSFFHEACHVLEHRTKTIYIDDVGASPDGDAAEQRANEFARDHLIPPDLYREFVALGRPTLAEIESFSRQIGIAPGIVVGRLQHDRVLAQNVGNGLKRRYQWDFE